ncbi:hypothetical protein AKJ16_DCAP19739 [Drosera capensis]
MVSSWVCQTNSITNATFYLDHSVLAVSISPAAVSVGALHKGMEWFLGVDDLGVDALDHSSKREDLRDTKQLQNAEDDSDDEEDQDRSPRRQAGDSSSPQDQPEDAYTETR